MDPAVLFGATVGWMTVVSCTAAAWYAAPAVARAGRAALPPLLLVHATRVVGLAFLAPAVTDPAVPRSVSVPAAAGDCATAGLALAAALAVRNRARTGVPLAWAANVVGVADLVYVSVQGGAVDFPSFKLGAAWFIPTVLGPVMIVTHGLMFWVLLGPAEPLAADPGGGPTGP